MIFQKSQIEMFVFRKEMTLGPSVSLQFFLVEVLGQIQIHIGTSSTQQQLPGRTNSTLQQLPSRFYSILQQLPGRTNSTLQQLPGRTSSILQQLPGLTNSITTARENLKLSYFNDIMCFKIHYLCPSYRAITENFQIKLYIYIDANNFLKTNIFNIICKVNKIFKNIQFECRKKIQFTISFLGKYYKHGFL